MTLSPTAKRVLSAIALVAIVLACIYAGSTVAAITVLVLAFLNIDEIVTNFAQKSRGHTLNIFAVSLIILTTVAHYYFGTRLALGLNLFGSAINIFLLASLFYKRLSTSVHEKLFHRFPVLLVIFLIAQYWCLASLFLRSDWIYYLGLALVGVYLMDTGAWFFGKNFGRTKLWPAVSPNKTYEGFLGGHASSFLFSLFYITVTPLEYSLKLLLIIFFIGPVSQCGDLLQSKIKRSFGVKDSSSLIPGHGGVYDRLDSLLMIAPFFNVLTL
jgi:phosphatidate cytidylyltransferase